MFDEDHIKEHFVRPMVLHVIDHERPTRRSLRATQKFVADQLGKTDRWLRGIIGRCPKARMQLHEGLTLVKLYRERKGDRSRIKDLFRLVMGKYRRTSRIFTNENLTEA